MSRMNRVNRENFLVTGLTRWRATVLATLVG